MSEKYISKDYLHDKFLACELEFLDAHKYAKAKGVDACVAIVFDAPTIEAESVKHGRWKIYNVLDYASRPTGRKVAKCSVCGQLTPDFRLITEEPNWHYCPNCGTKMDLNEVKE